MHAVVPPVAPRVESAQQPLPVESKLFHWLLLLVPLSLILHHVFHVPPLWVFFAAILAIVPLAEWVRRATEHAARAVGPGIGSLLNVTFGNIPELIIALFILLSGRPGIVKAQITGSIIGNSLLGLGLAIVVGGWGRERQCFSRERAGLQSSLLLLSVIALLVPALFDHTERGLLHSRNAAMLDERLSLGVSVVLLLVYAAALVYTLVTHRDVFQLSDAAEEPVAGPGWPLAKSIAVLLGATALVAVEAELVSGALEGTAAQLGLSSFFLGVIVLAVIGNAAEYLSAVYFARQDRMGLVVGITVGSSIQVALVVAPLLVLISHALGRPMDLVFANPLELIAVAGAAFAVNSIAQDGETTWFEGVLLLAVYAVLAMAFFFLGA